MKRICLIITAALVVAASVLVLWKRGGALPGATGPADGRASARPSDNSTPADWRPRQGVALQGSPVEPGDPVTAMAQITRGDNSVMEVRLIDGEYGRIQVEPNEVLTIRLKLNEMEAGREVRIDADHGGSLNRRLGSLKIFPESGQDTVEFHYAVGGHRGKYTLTVTQRNQREVLEFWAGPEPPVGRAGPMRKVGNQSS